MREPSGLSLCVYLDDSRESCQVLGCQGLPYMRRLCCCWRWMGGLRPVTLFSNTSRCLHMWQGMLESPEMQEPEYPPGTWDGF